MTTPIPTAPDEFNRLREIVDDLSELFNRAQAARWLPERRETDILRVQIGGSFQDNTTPGFELVEAARLKLSLEEKRQGEIARDRELKRLAYHMDRLRADLERLAREARFALVDVSREWRT